MKNSWLCGAFLFVAIQFLGIGQFLSQQIESNYTFYLNDSVNTLQIANISSSPVEFTFEFNTLFPISETKILDSISRLAQEYDVSLYEAAWRYVVEQTYHAEAFTASNWQHDPILFLNSIGGGLCDDRAAVLACIWKKMGFSARVIALEGHVVPEVFYNGDWHMFDPDQKVFYCDRKGNVLSVKNLESKWEYIVKPKYVKGLYLNSLLKRSGFFTHKLADYYKSAEDNRDATEWHVFESFMNQSFVLPSNSSLQIIQDPKTKQMSMVLNLSTLSKGKLKLPFVPNRVNGSCVISLNTETIHLSETNSPFVWKHYAGEMEIVEVESECKITFLVNEKLNVFKTQNQLKIESKQPVIVGFINVPFPLDTKKNANLFFDTLYSKHYNYLDKITWISQENIDLYLRKEYEVFLDSDSDISAELRLKLLNEFPVEMLKINEFIPLPKFKEYFPHSVYYLFLALRYREVNLFLEYIRKVN